MVLLICALTIGVVAANNWWLSFWLNAGGRILNSTSCSATNFSGQAPRNNQGKARFKMNGFSSASLEDTLIFSLGFS